MNSIDIQAYSLALHICSKTLQEPPDERFFSQVHEQRLFAEWPLKPSSPEASDALAALSHEYQIGTGDIAALRQDHLLLFSGPAPVARPWESVWRERDKLLFGAQTARVREFYAQWGIVVENYGHIPEDHLGLELAFCVHLLHRMMENGGNAPAQALIEFLDDHLLQWAEPCLLKAMEHADQVFYRRMPLLCLDALNGLRSALRFAQNPEAAGAECL